MCIVRFRGPGVGGSCEVSRMSIAAMLTVSVGLKFGKAGTKCTAFGSRVQTRRRTRVHCGLRARNLATLRLGIAVVAARVRRETDGALVTIFTAVTDRALVAIAGAPAGELRGGHVDHLRSRWRPGS